MAPVTTSAVFWLADRTGTMQVPDVMTTPAAGSAAGQATVPGTFGSELERAVGVTSTPDSQAAGASSSRAPTLTLGQMLARLGDGLPVAALGAMHAPVSTAGAPVGTPGSTGAHDVLGRTVRPLPSAVGSAYGSRLHPVHGDVRFHHGVDIAAPTGTPIRALAQGTVSFAGWRNGYGNLVIIEHVDGVSTRYAHQERIDVRAGQVIAAGDVLGTVGATGTATGPHLHFEVRRHGASIDPAPWLPG
jgi:murein DD-endopeptidase MepM/ murein hydrolase activator NlpD